MINLEDKCPNFIEAMHSIKGDTDMWLVSSALTKIEYLMTFQILNKKLGHISLELSEVNKGQVSITFKTLKNSIEYAQTTSGLVEYDLSVNEWIDLICLTMIEHNNSSEHKNVLLDFNRNIQANNEPSKNGCLSMFLTIVFLVSLFFTFLN
jgi:hypothetical protein